VDREERTGTMERLELITFSPVKYFTRSQKSWVLNSNHRIIRNSLQSLLAVKSHSGRTAETGLLEGRLGDGV
jgi:hypothetical protein